MAEIPKNPIILKKQEFEDFLKTIDKGVYGHWVEIARAIGVDKDTITAWKDHPRARAVREAQIAKTLKRMEEVGDRDWRMHEAKLKLLSVQATDKLEIDAQVKNEHTVIYKPEKRKEGDR